MVNFTIQGQSIENLKHQNNLEIKQLKIEYFKNLQENNDARIFSIAKKRNDFTYKRLKEKRDNAALSHQKNNFKRLELKREKQDVLTLKTNAYRDSIANELGYRRVSKAIENLEKKRKLEELRAANKREAFYRSQAINLNKQTKESGLKLKINSRHEELKKKYAVKKE